MRAPPPAPARLRGRRIVCATPSARATRLVVALCGLAALPALGGCELDEVTVPPGRERLVVHAVLNPVQPNVVILVERTLTGRVTVGDGRFDPQDPIVSGQGVPVSGAEVVLTDLTIGDTAWAPEAAASSPDGRGRGVYNIGNGGEIGPQMGQPPQPDIRLRILRGGHYLLRVSTPDATATAEVTVPDVAPIDTRPTLDTLNVDRDTLVMEWPGGPGASRYSLRVDSPFGPFFFFTDSLSYRLTGELRNLFAEDLPKVFVPGFTQPVQIAAVDQNFFDYYRSTNSPFTGSGIINHVVGGIGLVGAYMPLETRTVVVTGDDDLPVEGTYVPVEAQGIPFADTLRLFVFDRTRDGLAVSGYFRRLGATFDRYQLLGALDGTTLGFTGRSQRGDSFNRVSAAGTFAGDSIVIADQPFPGEGRTVFRKLALRRR